MHEQVMDILKPDGSDYLAMAVAFVAYFLVSFLWWGPLFGKKWAALMGYDPEERQPMGMALVLQAIGTVLLSYVLWHVMMAFAATPDHGAPANEPGLAMGPLAIGDAMMGAFFTWLGFFVPVQLGRVAWEKAPWPLFGINAVGHLVALSAMALAFALI